MTTEDRVRTVREAYQATMRANEDGLPWSNPWAAVVAALDIHDGPHTKALAEVATKLGYELGRKEAGEEIALAIEAQVGDGEWAGDYYRKAAGIARNLVSQPSGATSTPRTDPDGHSALLEDPQGLSNRNPVDLTKGGQ